MTAIIVSNAAPFGSMSNQAVRQINQVGSMIERVQAAAAQAQSNYGGVAGTEFENNTNFGVQQTGTPGEAGNAWQFAFNNLKTQWDAFIGNAQAYLNALDNG